jgi:hypothetical protein
MGPTKKICAKEIGIDIDSGDENEYFKWFLACLLFGKPIQQEVARRAYLELESQPLSASSTLGGRPSSQRFGAWQQPLRLPLMRGPII